MSNFIADYTLYTSGDEAPETYHIWASLSLLASLTGRRTWVNWGRFRIYPNLYVLLLGPPGNGKTTAMSIAKAFARELNVPFSAECQTKESICKEIVEHQTAFKYEDRHITYTPLSIYVTELSHFLSFNPGPMIDFLTTIYDQDVYDTKTKNKSNDLIIGPCINLLGCTTPSWITSYLRTDIISGGFTRRAVLVNEDEGTKRYPFPELSMEQVEVRKKILQFGADLPKVVGEFRFENAAKVWFANWYKDLVLPVDLSIRWYYRTKHVMALKVAMLISLAEKSDLVLTTENLQVALAVLGKIEPNLPRVFQGMGRNELGNVSQKVLDVLAAAGGALPEKKLLSVMFREATSTELAQVFEHLVRSDKMRVLKEEFNSPTGKAVRKWVCLPGVEPTALMKKGTT